MAVPHLVSVPAAPGAATDTGRALDAAPRRSDPPFLRHPPPLDTTHLLGAAGTGAAQLDRAVRDAGRQPQRQLRGCVQLDTQRPHHASSHTLLGQLRKIERGLRSGLRRTGPGVVSDLRMI